MFESWLTTSMTLWKVKLTPEICWQYILSLCAVSDNASLNICLGWLGGPPLFEQKYGHPRLRARHLPFAIDEQMRDQWIHCMNKALDINVENEQLKQGLKTSFYNLATHMINR